MFETLIQKLQDRPRRLVFTEGTDARILEAAQRLLKETKVIPLLVGGEAEVHAAAARGGFSIDGRALIVFLLLWGVHFLWRKTRGRNPSPIAMIALSAALGIVLWSF